MIFVDILAWSLSTIAYVLNSAVREGYTPTMKNRESAVRIGSMVGYKLRNPSPAIVSCEASILSPQSSLITIPKGTVVRTSDSSGIPFETVEDYYIEPGKTTPYTPILYIDPKITGNNVVTTYVTVTNGSKNIDLNDTSIDLSDLVAEGQTLVINNGEISYTIASVESSPKSISKNRLVLNESYQGDSNSESVVTIVETRIQLSQGQTTVEQYTSPSNTDNYIILLQESPVIPGSISLTVNSETYLEVENMFDAKSGENIFISKNFPNGKTYLIFNDGTFGNKIQPEADIVVTYRFGGGESGNVPKNSFETSITGIVNSTDNPITISITNKTSEGIGGTLAETVDEARYKIPEYIKANDRAVTANDYAALASGFSSKNYGAVLHAIAFPRRNNALIEGNVVDIYAWTKGPKGSLANLNPQLKQDLKTYLQSKSITTDYVHIKDGTSRPVPISVRFKTIPGFDVGDVKEIVSKNIADFVNKQIPGSTLIYSDLIKNISNTPGVEKLDIASPTSDISPYNYAELFTVPDDSYTYTIQKFGVGKAVQTLDDGSIELYTGQLPISPLQPWSISLFIDNEELVILPGLIPGSADIYGSLLSTTSHTYTNNITDFDPQPAHKFRSTVDLLTGDFRLWIKGAAGNMTMRLNTVQGYERNQKIDIFIGYSGDNSIEKRREIRTSIKELSKGLSIGSPLYGKKVAGITASESNISSLLLEVSGVTSVNRVALNTPNSTDYRVLASPLSLLSIQNIVINNELD